MLMETEEKRCSCAYTSQLKLLWHTPVIFTQAQEYEDLYSGFFVNVSFDLLPSLHRLFWCRWCSLERQESERTSGVTGRGLPPREGRTCRFPRVLWGSHVSGSISLPPPTSVCLMSGTNYPPCINMTTAAIHLLRLFLFVIDAFVPSQIFHSCSRGARQVW